MNLLDEEELKKLTGSVQPAKQKQVLDSNGIYYIERLDKTITTTWHHVNNPFTRQAQSSDAPDFSALG